jgi:hypothetical protein
MHWDAEGYHVDIYNSFQSGYFWALIFHYYSYFKIRFLTQINKYKQKWEVYVVVRIDQKLSFKKMILTYIREVI